MTKNYERPVSSPGHFMKIKSVMKLLSFLLLFVAIQVLVIPLTANGIASTDELQQRRVSGKVIDLNGNPLAGVNIIEKGTVNGAISGADGSYSLTVASASSVLTFSFIGYSTQEVVVGTQNTINATLLESLSALDEIVVVGYTTQVRKSLTGSVATINSDGMRNDASANAIQRIQGKASGVTVLDAHTPGGDAAITIRGMGTINNNNPLFVIDGVPTKWGMSQLNPNEIESVTILKDASSSAIYGARGANGVVIITTKRGVSGKAKVSLSFRTGFGEASNKYDLLNTKEFGDLTWLEAINEGKPLDSYPASKLYGTDPAGPVIPDYINPPMAHEGDPSTDPSKYVADPAHFNPITKANKIGTDWYDEIYRKAYMKDFNLSLSGGSNAGNYSFTAGYLDEAGILIHTGFTRLSIRSNAQANLNKWLAAGESLGFGYTTSKGNMSDNGEGTVISQAYRMQPIVPVYDIMGNFAGTAFNGTGNGENPVAILWRDRNDRGNDLRSIGNAYIEAKIIKDFHLKSLFGFDYRSYNGKDIFIKNPEFTEAKPTDILNVSNNYTVQWNWSNTLTYMTTVASDHRINVLIGSEALSSSYRYFGASRSTFYMTDVDYMYLDAGEKDKNNDGGGSDVKTMSYFGKVNYVYKDKYLAEATFRRDGSSKFGANNRWANFPAVSLGWTISNENFMANYRNFLNNLKIRVGWGKSGNDEIGDYNGYTTYSPSTQFAFYGIQGNPTSTSAGITHIGLGNPDAKWESTTTTDIGVDASLFGEAFTFSFDVWKRKTKDMLYQMSIPAVVGSVVAPSVNIGDMDNTGFDLSVNYKNKAIGGDFKYSLGLVVSHYKNKIVKLSNNAAEFIQGPDLRQMIYSRATVGTAFPEFYGLIVDGIFQSQDEADAYAPEYGGTYNQAGHFKFRDITGNDTIDDDDRTFIGSPHPKFTVGMNIDLSYKNFSLNAFLYSSVGNKMVNYVARWIDYSQFNGDRSHDALYDSWTPTNKDARLPKFDQDNISQYPSTAFVEDGSFLRLKTLQLGYSLPGSYAKKIGMDIVQIYVQATNLFTLTKYRGLDPELNSSGMSLGQDQGAWPTARQFMIGLKIDL